MRQMVKNLRADRRPHLLSSSRTVADVRRGDLGLHRADGRGRRGPDQLHRADLGSTMVEMAAQMQQLARNAEALAANVDETSSSIQQMTATLVRPPSTARYCSSRWRRRRARSTP